MIRNDYLYLGVAAVALVAASTPAQAGDTPIYAPAPAWVDRKPVPEVGEAEAEADFSFLLADRQTRMKDGIVESYSNYAYRVNDASLLAQFGNLSESWNPENGDFTVHRVAILRGGQVIDLVADGQKFTVLRREANLEKLSLDGVLTATMQLEGIKVGDTIVFESSTSYRDPSLEGEVNDVEALLDNKLDVKSAGLRILWPSDVTMRWKAPQSAGARLAKRGAVTELVVTNPSLTKIDMPDDAPTRYRIGPLVEVSSFADWQAVSRTASKAYAPRATIAADGELAGVVAGIAARTSDPIERTAAALRVVQDDIRYLFRGMENGNYTPQSPDKTWSLRFGDCKAKSLLLATMLRALGIEADVMLVNSTSGDALQDRLPSFAVFDHVIVRAMIDGRDYWLDGTRVGDRIGDIADTPDFGYALPVTAAGSDLIAIPVRPLGRPASKVTLGYDSSAGITLPTLFDVTVSWRTSNDNNLKSSRGAVSETEYTKMLDDVIDNYVPNTGISERSISFDEASDTTTIKARGLSWLTWDRVDGRYEREFNSAIGSKKLTANRSKSEWRNIAYSVGTKTHVRYATTLRLPDVGSGFAMVGRAAIDERVLGTHFEQAATLADGRFEADETWRTVAREIPAAQIVAQRRALAAVKADALRIEAPSDYPGTHVEAMLAARAHRLGPIMDALDKAVASAPKDEIAPLRSRAYVYELTQQYAKAIADLDAIIEIDPSAGKYLWRAELYARSDKARAEADIDQAFAIEPDSLDALKQLVELRLDHDAYDDALSAIAEREGLGIEDKQIAGLKASVLAAAGRGDEAMAALEAAGRSAQKAPELISARCATEARYTLGADRVLADCTRAIQLNEQPSGPLINRAIAYAKLGRTAEAIEDIDAAIEIDPDSAWAYYLRAVIAKGSDAARDRTYAAYIDPDVTRDLAKIGMAR
ncbi:DUF3857 domain-containing protein [Flavisphingopyxis soli]|nr:DUF3857 domain-containing protein [Sphingorhabdus soli]